jgi:hypothetical protein
LRGRRGSLVWRLGKSGPVRFFLFIARELKLTSLHTPCFSSHLIIIASTLDTSRKAALKQAKAVREATLAARIKRDQDRKDKELREIRRGVEAIKKALDALPPKVRIVSSLKGGSVRFGRVWAWRADFVRRLLRLRLHPRLRLRSPTTDPPDPRRPPPPSTPLVDDHHHPRRGPVHHHPGS